MNKLRWMLLVLMVMASFNCAVSWSAEETGSKEQATAPDSFSFVMDLECTEMAANFPIDPTLARQLVPMEYELDLQPDGKAKGALIVQYCLKLILDGEDIGVTGIVHHWIGIKGPHEMSPIPGAEKNFPTFYWYVPEDQTTSDKLVAAGRRAGMNYTKIERLVLEPTQGKVAEKVFTDKQVGYSWTNLQNPIPKTPVGMNLRFYHNVKNDPKAKDQIIAKGHVRCLLHVVSKEGSATIQADPESVMGKYEASILKGFSLDFQPMQCHAIIGNVGR